MRTFKANEELIEILKSHNFIEGGKLSDTKKSKKSFRLSETSKKQILFDYINIQLLSGSTLISEDTDLSEEKLKVLLMFFKLEASDIEFLRMNQTCKSDDVLKHIESFRKELVNLNQFRPKDKRVKHIERILNTYDNLTI